MAATRTPEEEEEAQSVLAQLQLRVQEYGDAVKDGMGITAAADALDKAQDNLRTVLGGLSGSVGGQAAQGPEPGSMGPESTGAQPVAPPTPAQPVKPQTQPGTIVPAAQRDESMLTQPGQITTSGFQPGAPAVAAQSNVSAVGPYAGMAPVGPQLSPNQRRSIMRDEAGEQPSAQPDLGNIPGPEQLIANSQGALRKELGLSPEYYQAERSSGVERFFRGLAQSTVFQGAVAPPQGATWKNITIEEILADDLLRENWNQMTEEEKSLVLMDGTGKAQDVLSLDEDRYARLMGGSKTQTIDGQIIQGTSGGLADAGVGGAPAGGAYTSAGGTMKAGGGGLPPGGRYGAPAGSGQESRAATGRLSGFEVVGDYGSKEEYTWAVDGFEDEGIERGRTKMMTANEAAWWVDNGYLIKSLDDANEQGLFIDTETGLTQSIKNRQYRSMTDAAQKKLRRSEGNREDAIDVASGQRTTVLSEMFDLFPGKYTSPETGAPLKVFDTYNKNKEMMISYATWRQAPEDQYIAATARQEIYNKEAEERGVGVRGSMLLTGMQVQRLEKAGPRAFTWIGKLGNGIARVMKAAGLGTERADTFNQWMSGGTLTTAEFDAMFSEFQAWVVQRKKVILNDMRLSDKDMSILQETLSLAEAAGDADAVAIVLADLTMFEHINNELKRAYNGEQLQFPVHTDEAAYYSKREMLTFGYTEAMADQIVAGLSLYRELNPGVGTYEMRGPGGVRLAPGERRPAGPTPPPTASPQPTPTPEEVLP